MPHQLQSVNGPLGPGSHDGVIVAPHSKQARFSLKSDLCAGGSMSADAGVSVAATGGEVGVEEETLVGEGN